MITRAPRSLFCLLAATVVACEQSPPAATAPPDLKRAHGHGAAQQAGEPSPDARRQIARLRALTARFHQFEAAKAAGWDAQITGCLEDPTLGGMGYHYGNVALIDGAVDVLEPELLLYEPRKNGKLRFVGVEYIVPFPLWTAEDPPELYGLPFHRNEEAGLWVLHVWHFRHNPSGIFADWNPKVDCDYAAP